MIKSKYIRNSAALTLVLATVSNVSAAEDLDKLLNKSSLKNFEPIQIKRQALDLSDAFQVQIYGEIRERGVSNKEILAGFDLLFANKYKDSFRVLDQYRAEPYVKAALIYLSYKLDYKFLAVNLWIDQLANPSFLDKQTTIALDQVMGENASKWLLKAGVLLTPEQKEVLASSGAKNIKFNDSLRALAYLRTGDQTKEAISYLEATDPLRLKLAESLVLDFAKKGELANAAKVLKGVFEPGLEHSNNIENISFYYLNLARLLYQAEAFDASKEYYKLIPDESKHYLTAQVEKMWIDMQQKDFSSVKGQVKTLELKIFENHFLPDRHLLNSMAQLQTCQFEQTKKSFDQFLNENRLHAQEIESQLKANSPKLLDKKTLPIVLLERGEKEINFELGQLKESGHYAQRLEAGLASISAAKITEAKRQWTNRKLILEKAIYRMRFVKVEYLSTMRRLQSKLALMRKKHQEDSISTKNAAPTVNNAVVFPFDGQFFADELFSLRAQIKNLCLKEKNK